MNNKENAMCGTPGFIAPETFKDLEYSTKSDVFSIGCILFQMLTGRLLFGASTFDEIIHLNKQCDTSMLQNIDDFDFEINLSRDDSSFLLLFL